MALFDSFVIRLFWKTTDGSHGDSTRQLVEEPFIPPFPITIKASRPAPGNKRANELTNNRATRYPCEHLPGAGFGRWRRACPR